MPPATALVPGARPWLPEYPDSLWRPMRPPGCRPVSPACTRCSWCVVLADHSALHMAGTARHHSGCSSQLSAAVETPRVDVESHQPPALCRLWVLLPGAGLYFAPYPGWHPNGGWVFSTGPRRQHQATPGKGHLPGGWSMGGSEESEETAGNLQGFSLP